MASSFPLLSIVRHGESEGNAARERAHADGAEVILVEENDRIVPLTERGIEQARALGVWLAADPPAIAYASPYRRTLETARIAAGEWPAATAIVEREAIRERSLGVLNRLTGAGIRARFPEEVDKRERLGKFEYRPPLGESWADVVERLRPFVEGLRTADERHIMVVTHQVVVLCMRYLLEDIGIDELLRIDAATDVANCSLTQYRIERTAFELVRFNDTAPLETLRAPVTRGNDAAGLE